MISYPLIRGCQLCKQSTWCMALVISILYSMSTLGELIVQCLLLSSRLDKTYSTHKYRVLASSLGCQPAIKILIRFFFTFQWDERVKILVGGTVSTNLDPITSIELFVSVHWRHLGFTGDECHMRGVVNGPFTMFPGYVQLGDKM